MSTSTIGRPEATEFADYQLGYVNKVPGANIMAFLEQQLEATSTLLSGVDDQTANYRYAPDKWTVKELAGHIIDTERVFAYRSLTFARSDSTALPGFDQDPWVKNANHANIPMKELAEEFVSVRRSTIHFFRHLDPAAWMRRGTANNNPITVRALAYLIAGHTEHHLEILRSRYLSE
jgi:hypothetical protein